MIPYRLLGGVAGIAFIIGLASGWQVRAWKAHSDEAKVAAAAAAQKDAIQAKYNGAANDFEAARMEAEGQQKQTRTRIKEVYRNVKVPANCAVPDAAVGLLENARSRVNSSITGEPEKLLPGD